MILFPAGGGMSGVQHSKFYSKVGINIIIVIGLSEGPTMSAQEEP
jgi:long-subunit acyl-CoA synthetase (AMP-forming)